MGASCTCSKRREASLADKAKLGYPVPPSSVKVFSDVPSLSAPSPLTSVISEPLDKFGDFHEVWDQLVHCLLHSPHSTKTKFIEIKQHRDQEFFINHHYDAKKLNTEKDVVVTSKWSIRRGQALIYGEMHSGPGQVTHRLWLLLHEKPLRAEMWGESNEFIRTAGAFEQALLQMMMDTMAYRIRNMVWFENDVRSLTSPKKSIVSEPLDRLFTVDMVWDTLIKLLMNPVQDSIYKSCFMKDPDEEGFSMMFLIDGYALKHGSLLHGNPSGNNLELLTRYNISMDNRTVMAEDRSTDGELKLTRFLVLHERPLRLECWGEAPDGTHISGGALGVCVRMFMNRIIWDVHGVVPVQVPPWAESVTTPASQQPAALIKVICEAPSPTAPGCKSVLSEEISMEPEVLFQELIEICKDSPKSAAIQETKLKQSADDKFTTQSTRSTGAGTIQVQEMYTIDRQKLCLISEDVILPSKLLMKRWLLVHRYPTRVECWGEGPNGSRKAGDALRQIVQNILTRVILQSRHSQGPTSEAEQSAAPPGKPVLVQVHADAQSPQAPWLRSVLSDPLDKHASFDDFWELLLDVVKNPQKTNPTVVSKKDLDATDTSFQQVLTLRDTKKKIKQKYYWNKKRGELGLDRRDADGQALETIYLKLHRAPLQLERWSEDAQGERRYGKVLRAETEVFVNGIIMDLKARQ